MTRTRSIVISTTAILLVAFCAGVSGQAAAPGPAGGMSLDCNNALLNASACLSYVLQDSKTTKPDEGCCGAMASLVDNNPICLCYLLGGQNDLGIQIDTKKALKLPSVCKVTTPPVSMCSAVGIPVGAPMSGGGGMVPTSAPPSTESSISPNAYPSTSLSPGSAPMAAVPSSTTNGASSIATGHALAVFFSFVIAFALTTLF